jgi:hypothetical protein
MGAVLNQVALEGENRRFFGTGGRSDENRACGFQPAFMDAETRAVYLSRFADGTPAAVHLLDGLPDKLVMARNSAGGVLAVKGSIVVGFVRAGRFYTRAEAGRLVSALGD